MRIPYWLPNGNSPHSWHREALSFLYVTDQAIPSVGRTWGSGGCAGFNSIPFLLKATPIATQPITYHCQALPASFFARPAQVVASELIGCLLVKRQANSVLLWEVVVETEAYSQEEPACHGYRPLTSILARVGNKKGNK